MDFGHLQFWQSSGPADGEFGQMSGTRGLDVVAGSETTINLVCRHNGNGIASNIRDSSLTAIFTAAP